MTERSKLPTPPSATERLQVRFGRALFFVCGGLLLSILVSCACGPVR